MNVVNTVSLMGNVGGLSIVVRFVLMTGVGATLSTVTLIHRCVTFVGFACLAVRCTMNQSPTFVKLFQVQMPQLMFEPAVRFCRLNSQVKFASLTLIALFWRSVVALAVKMIFVSFATQAL